MTGGRKSEESTHKDVLFILRLVSQPLEASYLFKGDPSCDGDCIERHRIPQVVYQPHAVLYD